MTRYGTLATMGVGFARRDLMRNWVLVGAFTAIVFGAASGAEAADYLVSTAGRDTNTGSSPASAWQTVQRVNNGRYSPGDRILFEGWTTFPGNLYFDGSNAGTPSAPVTIGSYGTGRATIYAADGTGILIYNAAGFVIRDLYIVGSGATTSIGRGIFFFTDLPGGVKLPYIPVDHVDAVRFGDYGVLIGANAGDSGYRDARITHTVASDNQMGGVFTYAQNPNVHEGVYVGYSSAFNNSGGAGCCTTRGTGSRCHR